MGHELLTSEVQSFLKRLVRRKARQLATRAGFTKTDREDIAQELTMLVLASLQRFDPDRGTIFAFVYTIVERKSATLLRRQVAGKRDATRCASLSMDVREDDGVRVEMASTITEDAPSLRLFQPFRHRQDESEKQLDIDAVIASLPRKEREICERLKSASPAEVARQLRMSRSALLALIKKIADRFRAEGLDEYR